MGRAALQRNPKLVGLRGFEPPRVSPVVSKTTVSAVPPQAEILGIIFAASVLALDEFAHYVVSETRYLRLGSEYLMAAKTYP